MQAEHLALSRWWLRQVPMEASLYFGGQTTRVHTCYSSLLPVYVSDIGYWGAWVAQSVKHLPLAQVMISESWDQALRQASLLRGEPASSSPSAPPHHMFSLSLSL